MRLHRLAAIMLVPAALAAQAPRATTTAPAASVLSIAPLTATHPAAADPFGSMRSALRNLATAQERYFGDHGTYTTDLAALGLWPLPPAMEGDGTWVQVLFAAGRGWSAMATNRAVKGKSCVDYVGFLEYLPVQPLTLSDRKPAEQEGAPTCDTP